MIYRNAFWMWLIASTIVVLTITMAVKFSGGGVPTDFPPEQTPGVLTVPAETDSIQVVRNGGVIARIYGPWSERAHAWSLGEELEIRKGLDYADTVACYYPLGDDIFIGFQDPQIPFLEFSTMDKGGGGGYAYEFRIFLPEESYEYQSGVLEIYRGKRGRELHFTPAGSYRKKK